MKVINEKGKLFGIINPVDLLIVLAILAVIAAACVKFLKEPVQAVTSTKQDMYVTLRIRGAMPSLADAVLQIQPGEKLVAGNDYIAGAEIISVAAEPYIYSVATADGATVSSTDPTKQDVLVVIKSSATPDNPVLKIGNQEIRAGRGFIFKTNLVEVNATIESVRFDG